MYPAHPRCPIARTVLATLMAHEPGSALHSRRVAAYAAPIARAVGVADLEAFEVAALTHDAGKAAVPAELLLAARPLSGVERLVMDRHSEAGAWILEDAGADARAIEVARSHHERWDGDGYPDHLAGAAIPHWARVVAVADMFDAKSYPRPYHPAESWTAVAAELERCCGTQFDPIVAGAALGILSELEAIRDRFLRPAAAAA